MKNNLGIVKELLKNNANVYIKNLGSNALIYAITSPNCSLEVVKELIKYGSPVNDSDINSNTPLILASNTKCIDVIDELIKRGANINALNNVGRSALFNAVDYGQLIVASFLIKKGINIDTQDVDGRTALMLASRNCNLAIVIELIHRGADIHKRSKNGMNALMHAANNSNERHGCLEVVIELIKHKIDINARTNDGNTAFTIAIRSVNFQVARELIKHGIDVNARDITGVNALMLLSDYHKHEIFPDYLEFVKELITRGANINQRNIDGYTAFMVASERDNILIIKELITRGVNINEQSDSGYTALILASMNGNPMIVKELITYGADIMIQDSDGKTAYNYAYENYTVAQSDANRQRYQQILTELENHQMIIETNEAIAADTSIPDNINLTELGYDIINYGDQDQHKVQIQEFINDNPNNTIVIKMIDSPTISRNFLFTRDSILQLLPNSIVYPCLKANGLPGRDTNVVTKLPLYTLGSIINTRILIKKDTFDSLLIQEKPDNLFVVLNKHVFSYPSIASHNVVFEDGDRVGGLHCSSAEPEKLYTIKRVNIPLHGGYHNKSFKYQQKLEILH